MQHLLVARQPIFDRALKLHGYELLYQEEEQAQQTAAEDTPAVNFGPFETDIEHLVGSGQAYIDLNQDDLLNMEELPLPADSVVLEISSQIAVTDEVKTALDKLIQQGYRIAIDNITPKTISNDLLSRAQVAKVDTLKTDDDNLQTLVKLLRSYPLQIVAEKVEDNQQADQLLNLGFDFLQGSFFSRPLCLQQEQLSTNQLAMMDLLAKVYDPEIDPEQLENVICQDASLSYHLLRYLNSAFFTIPGVVDSIRQAVIYLGRNELRSWATILSMASYEDKPEELISLAMIRGKMCQLLAEDCQLGDPESYFTMGLLSTLDALLDKPITELTSFLPLREDIILALNDKQGDMGLALSCCLNFETGQWINMQFKQLNGKDLNKKYLEAIIWTDDARKNMNM